VNKEIPGKNGESEDDCLIEISSSTDMSIETKHYRLITQEQYEADLKEAYFAGWEDRNDCELREIIHKRKATREEYFKWFIEEKKRVEPKVIFDDDDGQPD